MVGDVDELLVEQPRVDRVDHPAHPDRAVPGDEMVAWFIAERGDAVAGLACPIRSSACASLRASRRDAGPVGARLAAVGPAGDESRAPPCSRAAWSISRGTRSSKSCIPPSIIAPSALLVGEQYPASRPAQASFRRSISDCADRHRAAPRAVGKLARRAGSRGRATRSPSPPSGSGARHAHLAARAAMIGEQRAERRERGRRRRPSTSITKRAVDASALERLDALDRDARRVLARAAVELDGERARSRRCAPPLPGPWRPRRRSRSR